MINKRLVKIGDTVRLKASDRKYSKLSQGEEYRVEGIEPNNGYWDGSSYITVLSDKNGFITTLRMYENFFDIVSTTEVKSVQNKKFNIGDKIIVVKDTPQVPEGWIGYVTNIPSAYGYNCHKVGYEDESYAFEEHELELLSASLDNKLDAMGLNTIANLEEHTGGSVNYYKVHVANPTTLPEAYDAEANDIIESLGLTFAEGNLFKAIWRMAADRNGKKKKGNNSVYDAEKLVFFAERVLIQEKAKQ